jgi:hypothetical protein
VPYFTTSLTTSVSSAPGASTPCALNYLSGKPTSVFVDPSAASSAWWLIQFTMNDITRTPSSLVSWNSVTNPASAAILYASSTTGLDGSLYTFASPVAAVRMNSSSLSGVLTLSVIQGETGL